MTTKLIHKMEFPVFSSKSATSTAAALSYFMAFMTLSLSTPADTIRTVDGSTLQGTVTKMVDGKITIETSFAGELSIPWEQVEGVETSTELPIHLRDGSVIIGTLKKAGNDNLEVSWQEGKTTFEVKSEDVQAIAPPEPPAEPPVKWKGQVVGNLSATDGNSDTKSFGLSAETTRRSDFDRINLRGGYFYSRDDGDKTRDDLFVSGKYDYFLSERFYLYTATRFDRDTLKELDLRTTAGAGGGYQFLEDDVFNIFGETGISFVDENFSLDADDTSYAAARAAANIDWWILKEQLQYGQDFEFLLGLEDVEDWIAIWDHALSWKWNSRWSTQGSMRLEYDNTPAGDLDELDTRYGLGIGYSF